MAVFHIALEDPWILNTWDRLMIPKPFSRALMRVGTLMPVPADIGSEQLEQYNQLLQAALDRVKQFAEANVERVGSPDFPVFQRHKLGGTFPEQTRP